MVSLIHEMLTEEIIKTFRAIVVTLYDSMPIFMTTIKNKDGDVVVEFSEYNGFVHVDFTSRYSGTRKKLKTREPSRRSATFDPFNMPYYERPRIKAKKYSIACPTFVADFMREIGSHIRSNQPRGTRTPYSQKSKERHGRR